MSADHSELVIALAAAVGAEVGMVADQVATQLSKYGFDSEPLRMSEYLAEQAEESYADKPFDEQLWAAMSEGDKLRRRWERNDALALQAISDIVATREERSDATVPTGPGESEPANLERFAFILRSLKTPDELETLRAVYGPRLVVIGAYSPKDQREASLADLIEDSRNDPDRKHWTHQPEDLIARDEKEEAVGGQDVSGTFHRADFFIRAWDRDVIREDLERTMAILFGDPFRTPTRDEYGQFQAAGAGLRSAEFGRQVGAAIATTGGSVIAVGANEVPQYMGGSRWEGDKGKGNRDFEIGDRDTNRAQFDELANQLSEAVGDQIDQINEQVARDDDELRGGLDAARDSLIGDLPAVLRAGGLKNLTEFGRAVHAEMHAILDAARRGISIDGTTIYTTTFPCHNCARHIVGAGIRRVVFIEPYAKSRARTLHDESVAIDLSDSGDRVAFQPFVGVAPRRYLEMFDAAGRERLGHVARADDDGVKVPFDRSTALPVFVDAGLEQFRPELPGYRAKELLALEHFNRLTNGEEAGGGEAGAVPSETGDTHDAEAKQPDQEEENG
jgi:deoxycytidylate deaminase